MKILVKKRLCVLSWNFNIVFLIYSLGKSHNYSADIMGVSILRMKKKRLFSCCCQWWLEFVACRHGAGWIVCLWWCELACEHAPGWCPWGCEAYESRLFSKHDGGVCWSGFWCMRHRNVKRDHVLGHAICGQRSRAVCQKNAVSG